MTVEQSVANGEMDFDKKLRLVQDRKELEDRLKTERKREEQHRLHDEMRRRLDA